MKIKITLLITALLLPILSYANNTQVKNDSPTNLILLEAMDIKTLIEKAKIVSSQERSTIEDLIKKKISKAHREKYINR